MDHGPSIDALESIHSFPGEFHIKAIGSVDDGFEQRVVEAAASELATPGELDYTVRATPGGRHVAVSLTVTVQSAEQVRAIYASIKAVPGLAVLL